MNFAEIKHFPLKLLVSNIECPNTLMKKLE